MAGNKVVSVHVLDGSGKRVSIETALYHTAVNDVVIRPERGALGEIVFTNMPGRKRSQAIDNQKNGILQDHGDLFPTE